MWGVRGDSAVPLVVSVDTWPPSPTRAHLSYSQSWNWTSWMCKDALQNTGSRLRSVRRRSRISVMKRASPGESIERAPVCAGSGPAARRAPAASSRPRRARGVASTRQPMCVEEHLLRHEARAAEAIDAPEPRADRSPRQAAAGRRGDNIIDGESQPFQRRQFLVVDVEWRARVALATLGVEPNAIVGAREGVVAGVPARDGMHRSIRWSQVLTSAVQPVCSANATVPNMRKTPQLNNTVAASALACFAVQLALSHAVVRSCSRLTFVNLYRFRTSSSDHGHGAPAAFARRICSRVLSIRRNLAVSAGAGGIGVLSSTRCRFASAGDARTSSPAS